MITKAEIIVQPYSGVYVERIYDNESVCNSANWTFVKFVNDDYSEWCGQFRGFPTTVAISTTKNIILVLTSDYLYQLDSENGNLTELEDHSEYQNLTTTPNGDFVLVGYNNFELVTATIKQKELIVSPIQMDMIELKKWNNSKLEFTCYEVLNWDRDLTMTYDCRANKIEIK